MNEDVRPVYYPIVIQRLTSLGYQPLDSDEWMINFSIDKGLNHVRNEINSAIIPDGLFEIAVDMICGEFLNIKAMSGQLDMASLNLGDGAGSVSSIKEGDTTVSFSTVDSGEEKVKSLIQWMIDGEGSDFICYRKLRW